MLEDKKAFLVDFPLEQSLFPVSYDNCVSDASVALIAVRRSVSLRVLSHAVQSFIVLFNTFDDVDVY